jgi:hypothetical protein
MELPVGWCAGPGKSWTSLIFDGGRASIIFHKFLIKVQLKMPTWFHETPKGTTQ